MANKNQLYFGEIKLKKCLKTLDIKFIGTMYNINTTLEK